MGGGDDGADAGAAFGDGGEADAGGEESVVKERGGEGVGGFGMADEDRGNGRLRAANVEAETDEFGLEVAGVGPEGRDPLGFVLEDIEGGEPGGGDSRRMGGGEQKRAGAMAEIVDEILAAADVAAEDADRF